MTHHWKKWFGGSVWLLFEEDTISLHFDHPGHRGAVHKYNDCIKRSDYEKPYKEAIDLLETLTRCG